MEYYHQLVTEKSYKILQDLKRQFQFILIGGWAVFVYTHSLKSKDIDIIIDYQELEKIKNKFVVNKNERLKKYEIKIEDVDIDIYLPYYSKLGLPVEEIINYTQSREGFVVPKPEILLILKQSVYEARKNSSKGEKDKIDIWVLLAQEKIDWNFYQKILEKFNLINLRSDLINLIKMTQEVKELLLNQAKIAKLRKIILKQIEYND